MKKILLFIFSAIMLLNLFSCKIKIETKTETLNERETLQTESVSENQIPVTIKPLYTEVDMNNLPDGKYYVSFSKNDLTTDDNQSSIKFTIYSEDVFDAVEINNMKVGDEIWYGDRKEKVEKVVWDKNHSRVCINYWDDVDEAEEVFEPQNSGGIYRVRGMDDHCTYTKRGEAVVKLSENCKFEDSYEIGNEKRYEGISDVVKAIKENEYDNFICLNTDIEISNGEVVDINRKYIP